MEHVFSLPSLVVALSLVALASALVLLQSTLSGRSLPGCGPGTSCDQVTTSRWSRVGPVPTTFPGAALYLAMLGGAVLVHPDLHANLSAKAAAPLAFCSLLAAGCAIWFTALQAFVIRRFCRFCMITHLSAFAAAVLSLRANPPAQGIFIAAGSVLALFIIGQIAIVPKMYAITGMSGTTHLPAPVPEKILVAAPPAPTSAVAEPARQETVSQESQPPLPPQADTPVVPPLQAPDPPAVAAPRRLYAADKTISLSPHLWPVLGNRNAPHIIIDQFDYTCHFCRDLHKLLVRAMAERPDELAILMMLVPMDKTCNPLVPATPPEHRDACAYARYAMAVFRAAPEKFPEMDEWLFEPIRPWALDLVKMKAELLAGGPDKLEAAMNDPWMAKRHNEAVSIYNAVGQGQLPKLLFERAVVSGPVPNYEQLQEIFTKVQLFGPRAEGA